jgi:hypothetical protein
MTGPGLCRMAFTCAVAGSGVLGFMASAPLPRADDDPACISCDARHGRLADHPVAFAGSVAAPLPPQSAKGNSD